MGFLRAYFYKSAEVERFDHKEDPDGEIIFLETRVRHIEQLTKELSRFQDTNLQYYLDQKKFGI